MSSKFAIVMEPWMRMFTVQLPFYPSFILHVTFEGLERIPGVALQRTVSNCIIMYFERDSNYNAVAATALKYIFDLTDTRLGDDYEIVNARPRLKRRFRKVMTQFDGAMRTPPLTAPAIRKYRK